MMRPDVNEMYNMKHTGNLFSQFPLTLLRAEEIINRLVDRKWIKHLMVQVLKFENRLLLLVLRCFKWNILGVLDNTRGDRRLKSFTLSFYFLYYFFNSFFCCSILLLQPVESTTPFFPQLQCLSLAFGALHFIKTSLTSWCQSLIYEVNSY